VGFLLVGHKWTIGLLEILKAHPFDSHFEALILHFTFDGLHQVRLACHFQVTIFASLNANDPCPVGIQGLRLSYHSHHHLCLPLCNPVFATERVYHISWPAECFLNFLGVADSDCCIVVNDWARSTYKGLRFLTSRIKVVMFGFFNLCLCLRGVSLLFSLSTGCLDYLILATGLFLCMSRITHVLLQLCNRAKILSALCTFRVFVPRAVHMLLT